LTAGQAHIAALGRLEEDFLRIRSALLAAVLVAAGVASSAAGLAAQEYRTFRGCIVDRAAESVTLSVDGGMAAIGTAWLSADDLAAAAVDCVTIKAVRQPDGAFMAESIEVGDEANEVNSLTEETTNDREAQKRRGDDDE
jgi:hypothetical protein